MAQFTLQNYLNTLYDKSNPFIIPWDVRRPNEDDGFTRDEDDHLRSFCCELIQEAGIMLRLPQLTMSKGMEILHRLFFKVKFSQIEFRMISAACLFIAGKYTDNPKKLRDVVSVFDYLMLSKEGSPRPIEVLDLSSQKYTSLINNLIDAERYVLKEIGFSLNYTQPYTYLSSYLTTMRANKTISQKAWNFVNDSYRTVACVCFQPYSIACAAVYYAGKYSDISYPEVNWWEIFDTHLENIREIGSEVIAIYGASKRVETEYMYRMMRRCNMSPATMFECSFGNGPPKIVAAPPKEKECPKPTPPSSSNSSSSRSRSRHKHHHKHKHRRHHKHG